MKIAPELEPIDIEDAPDLGRIVDEIHKTNRPVMLRRNGKDVALITPAEQVSDHRPGRVKTREDYEAFLRSAGGWKGLIDGDKFIEETYKQRLVSTRPPVEL